MTRALILLAHGSRDPAWSRPLHELAARIRSRDAQLRVRVAFLEIETPHLSAVVDELAPQAGDISVLPVLWAAGGHVARDLPVLLAQAADRHPGLHLHALPPLAELPGMLDFVARTAVTLSAAPGGVDRRAQPLTRRTAMDTSIP